MNYILYLKESGRIIGRGDASNDDALALEDDVQGVVLTDEQVDPLSKYVNAGEIVDISASLSSQLESEQKDKVQLEMRARRNAMLSESDWTQLPDVPLSDKQAWEVYRQALRDLPESYPSITSLDEVEWPIPPDTSN